VAQVITDDVINDNTHGTTKRYQPLLPDNNQHVESIKQSARAYMKSIGLCVEVPKSNTILDYIVLFFTLGKSNSKDVGHVWLSFPEGLPIEISKKVYTNDRYSDICSIGVTRDNDPTSSNPRSFGFENWDYSNFINATRDQPNRNISGTLLLESSYYEGKCLGVCRS
jgi:hypothetical protein